MASMSCSAVSIKYLLFLFNFVFVITGIIIISVGVTVKEYYISYEDFLGGQYFSTPNLLIAIGSLIFFISFFGCCGAIKQNYCMIITFTVFLGLIFILEFSAGISGYVLRGETYDYLTNSLNVSMKNYKPNTSNEATKVWDLMQSEFSCCGINSYKDWQQFDGFTTDPEKDSTDFTYPLSCCDIPNGAVGPYSCNETEHSGLHKKGCLTLFSNYVKSHAITIGTVGLTFAALQLLAILAACHLAKQIRSYASYP